jgi:hypothetical protein
LLLIGAAQGKVAHTAEPPLGDFFVKTSEAIQESPPETQTRIREFAPFAWDSPPETAYCHNDPINNVDVLGLKKFPILNPTNPFVMKDGAWHRNEIFVHAADWFWQTSRGILPGTERVGRKAGPLDLKGYYLENGRWQAYGQNKAFAKGFADLGWDLDSGAELIGIAGGSMTALVTAPVAIASGITAAPAAYASTSTFAANNIVRIGAVSATAQQAYQRAGPTLTRIAHDPTLHGIASDGAFTSPLKPGALGGLSMFKGIQRGSVPNLLYKTANGAGDDLVSLFRAVEPEEFVDIMKVGDFRTASRVIDGVEYTNTSLPKQFGFVFDEVLRLADSPSLQGTAAIVETKIPKNLLHKLDLTPVDESILRSGSVTVHHDILELFNQLKTPPTHKF